MEGKRIMDNEGVDLVENNGNESEFEAAFFKRHDELPEGVYLVEVYQDEATNVGIFSTRAGVREFLAKVKGDYSSITAPFVVDVPEFGNVKVS